MAILTNMEMNTNFIPIMNNGDKGITQSTFP